MESRNFRLLFPTTALKKLLPNMKIERISNTHSPLQFLQFANIQHCTHLFIDNYIFLTIGSECLLFVAINQGAIITQKKPHGNSSSFTHRINKLNINVFLDLKLFFISNKCVHRLITSRFQHIFGKLSCTEIILIFL